MPCKMDLLYMYVFQICLNIQDEEGDPLLKSFSKLKDLLNSISGKTIYKYDVDVVMFH
jgi:hypothetical protein